MPDEQSRAEILARQTAEMAAKMAAENAVKLTQDAVDRAVKDTVIERDLQDHARHLETINGSQRAMANSLERLEKRFGELSEHFSTQLKIQDALAEHLRNQQLKGLSRRTVWITVAGVLAAYLTIIALLLQHGA